MVKQARTLPKKKTEWDESSVMTMHPAYDVLREWMLERKRCHTLARIIMKEQHAYTWEPWTIAWHDRGGPTQLGQEEGDKMKEMAKSYEQRRLRSGLRLDAAWVSKNIEETDFFQPFSYWEQPCSCLTCDLLRKMEPSFDNRNRHLNTE